MQGPSNKSDLNNSSYTEKLELKFYVHRHSKN